MTQPTETQTIETSLELEQALDELDRVIHRSKVVLERARQPSKGAQKNGWNAIKGLWKGRVVEDAVTYQRRVREEFEEHAGV